MIIASLFGRTRSAEVVFVTFPLHEAVKQKNAYLASKLLLFGADPTMKDSWGRTAHDYAKRKSSNPELLQIIDSWQAVYLAEVGTAVDLVKKKLLVGRWVGWLCWKVFHKYIYINIYT